MEPRNWYDVLPAEYVERLRAGRLLPFLESNPGGAVVEVAAGDGRLAAYLSSPPPSQPSSAANAPPRLKVTTTDDNSWGDNTSSVLPLTVAAALADLCSAPETPTAVLLSWPPQDVDFTADIRTE